MRPLSNEIEINEYFIKQVLEFKQHIKRYQKSLNNEGVWLFLAALGCWGVPDKEMQNASFIITIIIFFYRLYLQLEEKRSFKQISNDIELEIDLSNLFEDVKKARLYDLSRLKTKELSVLKTFKSNIVFIICLVFTIFSMEAAKTL